MRGVELALTYRCNSSCSHCSCERLLDNNRNMLSLNSIKKAADLCIEQGALQINLTGGEALYHPDILDIAEYIGSKNIVLSLATNGVLLTKQTAKALSERNVRIISISMDSANAHEHDKRHKYPGCFDKAIKAIRNSLWAGMDVFLCTICTPENMQNGDMWNMIRLAEKFNITITLNIACPVGAWDGNKAALLGKKELKEYKEMLKLPHVRWEGGSNYIKEGCPAGIEKIYISPYGDVMPCPRVHISYGNLNKTPLKEIWNRMTSPSSPFHASNYDYEGCPAGDNMDFIEKYISPVEKMDNGQLSHNLLKTPDKCDSNCLPC